MKSLGVRCENTRNRNIPSPPTGMLKLTRRMLIIPQTTSACEAAAATKTAKQMHFKINEFLNELERLFAAPRGGVGSRVAQRAVGAFLQVRQLGELLQGDLADGLGRLHVGLHLLQLGPAVLKPRDDLRVRQAQLLRDLVPVRRGQVLLASSSNALSGEVWLRRARLDRGMLDGRCFSEDEIR
ncbi:hypothetical protein EYF80_018584 [Liparis tanakae]|uniref:Uncharacterized protein n=1 Tax=Liparis tanakae TaxID=230148 RepID=A0A4Z2HZM9_9TELE|nr:hypothetical protein EYF80_018584 [Liparis tanakae]